MTQSKALISIIVFMNIVLSGCQTAQQKTQPTADIPDPDIVVMSGIGSTSGASDLLRVKPMTFEELTVCATKIDSFMKDSAQLKIEKNKFTSWKSELDKLFQGLESERQTVNSKITKQVVDFNKRAEQARVSASKYNSDINSHNDRATALNLKNNEFNISCANRPYRQSEYAQLSADLRTAVELRSKISDVLLIEDATTTNNPSKGLIHLQGRSSK
jgi:hypothetical protein